MSHCPPRNLLADFAHGLLADGDVASVSAHVEACPTCRETLSSLTAAGESTDDMARSPRGRESPSRPAAVFAISRQELKAAAALLGFATPDEIDALTGGPESAAPAEPIAERDLVAAALADLVARDKLTPYQAEVIGRGEASSLRYGEYVVADLLGEGGMGRVFKARHLRMRRVVALKILSLGAKSSAEAVSRFQREVVAAGMLNHPNIVLAYDASESAGVHFLVMEYVDGRDLSRLVHEEGPLPSDTALDYMAQTAHGLEFAHRSGLVHRDIKPGNLLVTPSGTIKILDMGLARISAVGERGRDFDVGELTKDGRVFGTLDYLAPEQALDTRKASAPADLYSLGCTLFRILIDRPIYPGETTVEKILAHRDQPIPSLRKLRADVPEALDALFQRLVAKQEKDRPTAAEAARAFEALRAELRGEPTAAYSASGPIALRVVEAAPQDDERTVAYSPPPQRMNPRPAWIASAAAAVIGAWLAIARPWQDDERPRDEAPRSSVAAASLATALSPTPTPPIRAPLPSPPTDAELTAYREIAATRAAWWNTDQRYFQFVRIDPARWCEMSDVGSINHEWLQVESDGLFVLLKRSTSNDFVRLYNHDLRWSVPLADGDAAQWVRGAKGEWAGGGDAASIRAAEQDEAGKERLRKALLEHSWTYRDSGFGIDTPSHPGHYFYEDGTYHYWKFRYWVTGPKEMRMYHLKGPIPPGAGHVTTFNDDLTAYCTVYQNNGTHVTTGKRLRKLDPNDPKTPVRR
jgi:serine/threonine protein kinase